jgi:hypothetical protein
MCGDDCGGGEGWEKQIPLSVPRPSKGEGKEKTGDYVRDDKQEKGCPPERQGGRYKFKGHPKNKGNGKGEEKAAPRRAA